MKPIIAEAPYRMAKDPRFNTINIYLDARPHSDLSWETLDVEIQTALKLNAKLSFELDFGFSEERPLFKDAKAFQTRALAVSYFEERVLNPYRDHIASIILYRASADFRLAIFQDANLEEDFNLWKADFFPNVEVNDQILRVFSMEIFMRYLHRVAAPLIDEIPLLALIDLSGVKSEACQAELLSKIYFPYIMPAVKGSLINFSGFGWEGKGSEGVIGQRSYDVYQNEEPSVGVVLPELGALPYKDFDRVIKHLFEKSIHYKIIPESLLTDMWYGIDKLIVFTSALSAEGLRMLKGFNAAAGLVVTYGDSLNLIDEISFSDFENQILA